MTYENEFNNLMDTIDVRDVIARFEELDSIKDNAGGTFNDEFTAGMAEEFASLRSLLDELKGNGGDEQWRGDWYPVTLIRESYFVEAMQELCDDIGDIPKDLPSYVVIDWEATADNLRVDYQEVEFEGVTYLYR